MKTIDEQINEVLRLAGVQQLNEGKIKDKAAMAVSIASILLGIKMLNKPIDVKKDLNAIYNNATYVCNEENKVETDKKSGNTYMVSDYTVTCKLPEYNYGLTIGLKFMKQTNNETGEEVRDIIETVRASDGNGRKMHISPTELKLLKDRVENLIEKRIESFDNNQDENGYDSKTGNMNPKPVNPSRYDQVRSGLRNKENNYGRDYEKRNKELANQVKASRNSSNDYSNNSYNNNGFKRIESDF